MALPGPDRTITIENVPRELGAWRSTAKEDQSLHAPSDREVLRLYRKPGAPPIGLFLSEYCRKREVPRGHTPLVCYPGTGWGIKRFLKIHVGEEPEAWTVSALIVEKGERTEWIVFGWLTPDGLQGSRCEYYRWAFLSNLKRGGVNYLFFIVTCPASDPNSSQPPKPLIDFCRNLLQSFRIRDL